MNGNNQLRTIVLQLSDYVFEVRPKPKGKADAKAVQKAVAKPPPKAAAPPKKQRWIWCAVTQKKPKQIVLREMEEQPDGAPMRGTAAITKLVVSGIRPGSHVISDGWKATLAAPWRALGYTHDFCVHSAKNSALERGSEMRGEKREREAHSFDFCSQEKCREGCVEEHEAAAPDR